MQQSDIPGSSVKILSTELKPQPSAKNSSGLVPFCPVSGGEGEDKVGCLAGRGDSWSW